jgi:hypothetical protein
VVAISASLSSVMAAGSVSEASALPFCDTVVLQPWGKAGDTCYAGLNQGGVGLAVVTLQTHERAGCVSYAGYYGELYHSWTCTGNNSLVQVWPSQDGGWYRGVIRNNNTSWAARFGGAYQMVQP